MGLKRNLKKVSLGLLTTATVMTLAACGNSQTSDDKVLNVALTSEVTTLDISKQTDTIVGTILGNTGSNLLRVDDKGELVPDLAEKLDISEDGLTYTATLRDGLKWSDGSDLTAEDFVYSWQRILDPKTASQSAYLAVESNIKNAKEINEGTITDLSQLGVKAEGNKVIFTLTSPTPQMKYFLAFSSFLPQKKSFVEKEGDKYGTTSEHQLYSGPYVFEGWNGTNNEFKFVKNKNYWNADQVKTETVNLEVIKKPETAVQKYKQGQLDFANISSTPSLYKANAKDANLVDVPEATSAYLEYNQTGTNKALANKKIRQALNLATNRETFVETVVPTGSRPATGLAPYGLATVGGKDLSELVAPGYTYDLAEAKKLFEEGLKEIGESKVSLTITADSDSAVAKSALTYLQGAWEKAFSGLTIETKFVPLKQRLEDASKQNFDIIFSLWMGDYPEGSTFYGIFAKGAYYNSGQFDNVAYNQAYQEAITTNALNPEKAVENYKAAEKALMDEANFNPLFFRGSKALQNPDLTGVVRHTTGLPLDLTYAYKK